MMTCRRSKLAHAIVLYLVQLCPDQDNVFEGSFRSCILILLPFDNFLLLLFFYLISGAES